MRQTVLFFSFFFLIATFLTAQKAPDFQLTTSSGQSVELYRDYLDQGKSVVIEIFFVSCPPCRQLAPHMSTLYKDLQSRKVNVEFISLSTLSRDSDEDIEGFKTEFDHPWPFVGFAGGSEAALTVYQDGTYGAYWGTPTTLVIAPDGSVNYNVRGDIASGTWTSNLEQAILESQAAFNEGEMPATAVISGSIQSLSGGGLSGVSIAFSGASDTIIVSDENGNFATEGLLVEESYTLTPQKNDRPVDGVTTADIIRISQHILGIAPFTDDKQIIAADVNGSGSVTTFDLVQIRQLILGILTEFPNGSWIFDPASVTLDNLNDLSSLSFTGVKKGDANGSANLIDAEERKPRKELALRIDDQFFQAGETIEVPIYTSSLDKLQGFQFTLEFDPSVLEFESIADYQLKALDATNFNLQNSAKGLIATSWHSMGKGQNGELFTLRFTTQKTGRLNGQLAINSKLTKAEVYPTGGTVYNLNLAIDKPHASTNNFKLYPNPTASNQLFLDLTEEATERVQLSVLDVSGKLLSEQIISLKNKNSKQVPVELPVLKNGVYFLRIQSAQQQPQILRFVKL